MGNKLSCSCTPLIKKAYKYDEAPFKPRREGRLWAEVFHVSAASGVVRWQQVSEDLVPVSIKCVQDQPDFIFKITAYNSHIERILDVTIRQPGTRLGQASECFVYWKDTTTGDTWGLNFTSPLDAKQFRELCSPSYKFSRKASSSYSLRLNEPPSKRSAAAAAGAKRKPQSTPSSPNRRGGGGGAGPGQELQCTCMTVDTLHKQRNGRVRYTASANTLPKSFRQDSAGSQSTAGSTRNISAYPSTNSVNAAASQQQQSGGYYRGGQQVIRPSAGKQTAAASLQSQQQQQSAGRSAQYSRAQYAQSSKRSTQSRSFDQPASQYSSQLHQQQTQQQLQREQQQQQQQQQQKPPKECMSFPYQPPYHRSAPSHVNAQVANARTPGSGAQAAAIAAAQQQQSSSRSKSSDDVRRQLSGGPAAAGDAADQNLDPNVYRKGQDQRRGQQQQARGPRPTSGPAAWSGPSGSYPMAAGGGCGDARCTQGQCKMLIMNQKQRQAALKAQPAHHNASLPSPATKMQVDRSRVTRSATGRRRSLERMQCFDYTDLSPTTADQVTIVPNNPASNPAAAAPTTATPSNLLIPTSSDQQQSQQQQSNQQSQQKQLQHQRGRVPQRSTSGTTPTPSSSGDEQGTTAAGSESRQQLLTNGRPTRSSKSAPPSGHRSGSPTIKVLQEYEHHLRTALAKGNDADTYSLNTFETILSQSMENVVALMKEVQSEIEAIRREESHYRCTSAFGFRGSAADEAAYLAHSGRNQWSRSYTLPSRGTSLPPSGFMGSSSSDVYHSAVRKASGALLLDTLSIDGAGGMQYLRPQSSFESTASDSRMYLTSSEVSVAA